MLGTGESQDMAGIFQNEVLKPSTSTQQGNSLLASQSDGGQRAVQAAIGAGRSHPDAVKFGEAINSIGGGKQIGANPFGLDVQIAGGGAMFNGLVRGLVRTIVWFEITDDGEGRFHGRKYATRTGAGNVINRGKNELLGGAALLMNRKPSTKRNTLMKMIHQLSLSLILFIATLPVARAETSRTDINPALLYYQSFILDPHLADADRDFLFNTNWQGRMLPERFGTLIDSYHNDFRLLHQAALQTAPCDWGIDFGRGPETLLPHLALCKRTVQAARLHAMWALQQGDEAGACDNLLGAMTLGRNTSRDGTLIAALVQIAIENIVLSSVAENFYRFSPAALQQLDAGLDAAPARGMLAACVTAEKSMFRTWLVARIQETQKAHPGDEAAIMQELQHTFASTLNNLQDDAETAYWQQLTNAAGGTSDGLIKLSNDAEAYYEQLAVIMTQPHGPFEEQFKALGEAARQAGNFLFSESLNTWPNSRRKEFTIQAELAMVHAAIEYRLHGETGFQSVADPLGKGVFAFEHFVFQGEDRGFKLTTAYAPTNGPISMIFVTKAGPAFYVLGNHVGEAIKQ